METYFMSVEELNNEIARLLDIMKELKPDSDEYRKTLSAFVNLCRIREANEKLSNERYDIDVKYSIEHEKHENDMYDINLKHSEHRDNLRKEYVRIGAGIGGALFVSVLTIHAEEIRVIGSKCAKMASGLLKFV